MSKYKKGVVVLIPVDEIMLGANSRWDGLGLDKEKVNRLAKSFNEDGQLQACQVREDGDALVLVYGFHRHAAMVRHNELFPDKAKELKCIISVCNAEEALQRSIVENRLRSDPTPMDDAFAQRRLREDFQWTDKRIAEFYAISEAYVSYHTKLLTLSKDIQRRVHSRELSITAAFNLATAPEGERANILAAADVPKVGANGKPKGTTSTRVQTAIRERRRSAGKKTARTIAEVRTFFKDLAETGKGETSDLGKLLVKFMAGEITSETMARNLAKLVQA